MKTRTLLVDSSYLLKRSFHGAREMYSDSFGHIGGLYSFMTTLRKLIKEHAINKVVLMWDGENGGVHRHQIDKSYKANRKDKTWHERIMLSEAELRKEKEKEESILRQRKRIQEYAEELFLRQVEVDEIEADDLIASYCIRYNNKEEIFLFSNDRDFAQLLDLNVVILFDNIDTPITRKNFFHFFSYHYSNALTIKIICGDVSDNIKGVAGVKEKTLMKHFPELQFKTLTVREICKKSNQINKDRLNENKKPLKALENLINSIDRLKTNYRLINLKEPILNDNAIEELEQLDMPLSPTGRSSKNLHKLMTDDGFLVEYKSTFVNYVQPFYTVIMHEKDTLKEYKKKK